MKIICLILKKTLGVFLVLGIAWVSGVLLLYSSPVTHLFSRPLLEIIVEPIIAAGILGLAFVLVGVVLFGISAAVTWAFASKC